LCPDCLTAEIERLTGGARVVSRDLLFRYIRDGSDTVPTVALREAVAEIERLRAEMALALGEATRLLESFVIEHCNPVPEWKPLPDLIGVLSQLSNAVTVTRDYRAEIERLTGERAGDQQRLFHYEGEIERLKTKLAAERERCVQILKWYATDDGRLMQNDISLIVADIRGE